MAGSIVYGFHRKSDAQRAVAMARAAGGFSSEGPGEPGATILRHFELKDDLSPGDTVTAHSRSQSATTGEFTTNTDTSREYEVVDLWGIHRGRGRDEGETGDDIHGSYGFSLAIGKLHVIMFLQPAATKLKAAVDDSGGVETTDGTITVDGVVVTSPIGGLLIEREITSVTNMDSEGDDNDIVYAEWNQEDEVWEGVILC